MKSIKALVKYLEVKGVKEGTTDGTSGGNGACWLFYVDTEGQIRRHKINQIGITYLDEEDADRLLTLPGIQIKN